MATEFIDLGCGLDSPAMTIGTVSKTDANKKVYPTFYFSCDEPIDLPDGDFTFTAKGRKILGTEDTKDKEDPRYRYEIEVHGFKPDSGKPKNDGLNNVGDILKKAMRAKMQQKASAMDDEETMDDGE